MHKLPRIAGYLKVVTAFTFGVWLAGAAFSAAGQESAHRMQPLNPPESTAGTSLEEWVRSMPEAELRQLYLRCARISERRRLEADELFACSVGQDALLARSFGGDFDALQAWAAKQLASSGEIAQR